MIPRFAQKRIETALARQAAVAVIGPRQVGKTTLAQTLAEEREAIYLDLESLADREKLADPVLYLEQHAAKGAEIDLVLEMGAKHGTWAIEVKRNLTARVEKGFRIALNDLKLDKAFVVYPGNDRYPKGDDVEAISLSELAQELADLN